MANETITKLSIARSETHKDAAALLRRVAESADAGEVTSVSLVTENRDGTYTLTGSSCLSRREMMGALLELIIWRSGNGS